MTDRLLLARVRLAALLGVVTVVSVGLAVAGVISSDDIEDWVDDSGAFGPVVFVGLVALLTVALFPGTLAGIAAGALFGPVLGTALTVVGATLGATGSFLLGRRLGRAEVQRVLGDRGRRVDAWLGDQGLRAVLVLRLAPVVPFNAANVVLGTTSVTLRDYVVGTAVGIVPGSAVYVVLGSSVTEPGSPEFLLSAAALLALSGAALLIGRRS